MSATVSNLSVAINTAGGTDANNAAATAIDWTKDVSLDGGMTFGATVDPGQNLIVAPTPSLAITATMGGISLSGSLASLNIFNVISGSAYFALSEQTATISFTGMSPASVTGATLLTLAVSNLQASAGSGGFGVSINGGDLGLAVLEAPAPASGTDSRYWLAVTGSDLGGSLSLSSAVSATVTGLSVAINTAGGTSANNVAATAIDWTKDVSLDGGVTFGATVDPGANLSPSPTPSLAITATSDGLTLSGSLASLNIFNVITAKANFALSETTAAISFTGAAPADVTGATLLTLALTNLTAGVSGSGVSITGGNLGIAVLEAPTDSRYWLAVTATNLAGSLVLGSSVSASVSGLSVLINTAGGKDSSGVAASPLNWKSAVSVDGGATFGAIIDPGAEIAPGGSVSLPIMATGGVLLLSGTLSSLNIFNVINGSANFALSESTVNPVVNMVTLTGASLLTVGLSNLVASAGAGGFGVSITGGNLGIALLEAPKPQSGTDNRYWLTVVGNGLAGSLALGSLVSASVSKLSVAFNSAGGQATPGNTQATPLDWGTVFVPPIDPGANILPAGSVSLQITANGPQSMLSGTLTSLNIFNVITGSSSFALSQTTVNPVVNGTTLTGATLLTLGLGGLVASAGAGGFGVSIGGNLGIALLEAPPPQSGTDSRYWLAVIGNSLKGSLSLGTAISASVSGVTVAINSAGGQDATNNPAMALDWGTVFTSPAVDPGMLLSPQVNLTIGFNKSETSLGGTLTGLNIFNVITGSAGFALEQTTATISFSGMAPASVTNATLLTLALGNLQTTAGGAFGVSINGGNLGIAVLEAPSPQSGTDSRYWLAVTGNSLAGTLNLGGSVNAMVADMAVSINTAGGSSTSNGAATPIDWTKEISLDGGNSYGGPNNTVDPGANLPTAPSPSLAITATASGFSLSGSLTSLNVFNILSGSANFALSESTVGVAIGTTHLTGATLITVAFSNLAASAGLGGFGVAVTAGDLGIAYVTAPVPSSGTDTRYWLAVDGTNLAATLKLGNNISATVNSITAQINQAGGSYTPAGTSATAVPAVPLDWTTDLDLNGDGVYGGPGDLVDPGVLLSTKANPLTMPIQFPSASLALSGSLTSLNIYNLITGSANFAFSQTTVSAEIGAETLTGATLLTLGLSDLQGGAGNGAFGVSVSSGDLGIAVLESSDGSSNWIAVDGTNLAATVNLGGSISATVSSVTVQINQAVGAATSTLDWATGLDLKDGTNFGGYGDTVDPGANLPTPVPMPITYTSGPLLLLSGALVNLKLDNLVTGSANFAIAETTVDVAAPNALTGAPMLTVALTNLQASGLGVQISGGEIGIAVIEPPAPKANNDTRYWFAVVSDGISVTLNLGSDITLSSGSASLVINDSGGSDTNGNAPSAIDWKTDVSQDGSTIAVDPGANPNLTITSTGQIKQLTNPQGSSGSEAQFNIDNLVTGKADFSLSQSTVLVNGQQDLTTATLYALALTNLYVNAQAGGFGLSLGNGGSIGIAALLPPTPSSGVTDSRYWVAVTAAGLGGSLALGGVSASVSGLSVMLNLVGGSYSNGGSSVNASTLDWSSDLSFDNGSTYGGTTNEPSPGGLTISYSGPEDSLAGSLSSLNIFNLITGSADFALSESIVNVEFNGTSLPNLTGATLIQIGLSNLMAAAGTGGFGVSVTSGNLGIAAIEPADSAVDGRTWVAVYGTDLGASLKLGSAVSATVSSAGLQINQADGKGADNAPATPLNWAADISTDGGMTYGGMSNTVDPGANLPTPELLPISFTGPDLGISGTLSSLNIFNVITGAADFALSQTSINVSTGGTTLSGATLLTLALNNLQAAAGFGGFGVAVTGGALGLAILEAPAPTQSGATDSRSWVAVTGSNLSANLSLTANITASVANMSVAINQASGSFLSSPTATPVKASPLNWTADLDSNGDGQFGTAADQLNPGASLPTPIALPINFTGVPGAQLALDGTLTNLNIFNVITASAGFALSESTVSVSLGNNVTLSGATLLTLGLNNLSVSAGAGAFGVSIGGGTLGVALLEPPAPTQMGITDTRYWVAVTGANLSANLSLGASLTASVSDMSVSINQAGGTITGGSSASALDWTAFSPLVDPAANIPPQGSVSLPINFKGGELLLSGSLTHLNVFNLIDGSANFALALSTVDFKPDGTNVTNGATLLTLGLSDIVAAAGAGGFGLTVTGGELGIAVIEPPAPTVGATDSRYWLGVDGSGLTANLALGGVTATVTSFNLMVNQAGGSFTAGTMGAMPVPAVPLDWAADISLDGGTTYGGPNNTVDAGANIPPVNSVSLPIAYTDTAGVFQIGGNVQNVNIFNLISGSAAFALSRTTTNVSFTGSGNPSLAGASLVEIAFSCLNLSIGTSGFGLSITGGDIGIAVVSAPTPASGSDSRYWLAVDATGLTANLSMGPGFMAAVSKLNVQINQAGGSYVNGATTTAATPLDWTMDLDPKENGTYGTLIDPGTLLPPTGSVSLPIKFTGATLGVSGSLTGINLFGLITGGADFAITVSTTNVAFSGLGKPDLTGATLITLALSNLQVAVGATGFGVAITGGDLGIAAIEAPTPAAGTDNREWIAVDGANLSASLTVGTSISATVNSLSVQINRASGDYVNGTTVPAVPLDWADDLDLTGAGTYGGKVDPGATLPTPVNLSIGYTGAALAVSGTLANLNIFNLLVGSASFAISISTINVSFSGMGSSDLTGASLLTVALSNLQLAVGLGSFGLAITGGNVGIAAIEPPTPQSGKDDRLWVAVNATGLSASLNLGGSVSASVSNLSVQINNASGTTGPAPVLDWTKDLDLNQNGTYGGPANMVNPGASLPMSVNLTIGFTGPEQLISGSLSSLNIFNLITGSADFAIAKKPIDLSSLNGATSDLKGATLLTIALDNLNLQVGAGGYGLSLTGGDLGIAAIIPGPIPTGTTATDNRVWIAVDGSIQTVSLGLGGNITASASNVTININQASGAYVTGGKSTPATALDWTTLPGEPIDPGANLPNPVPLPLVGNLFTTASLQVQATVVLAIENYVYISGSVSFTKTGPIFVTPAGGEAAISVNAIEIGASNVYAFVGTGGPYWIMNPDGSVSAPTAAQSAGALGLALSNINLGLAFLSPTAAGGTSYYALSASGTAALVGVSGLKLSGTLGVQVNRASTASAPVIDFTQLSGNSLSIPTGPNLPPVDLNFSTNLLRAYGSLTLCISQFAFISGNFDFEKGATQSVTVGTSDPVTENMSAMEVGVSNVYAFAGVNGPYWIMNGNGSIRGPTASESIGAMGLALSQASLGLALLKPLPTTALPNPTISYLALKVSGSVAFVGINGLTLSANNLSIEVNQATDSQNPNSTVPAVNLTSSSISIPTDANPADNIPLNFASGPILAAQGTVTIAISQFVYLTGSVSFTKGATQAVTLTGAGGTKDVSVLTVGASNVYAFAGIGGPYWVTNPDGSVQAPSSTTAVGVALGNLSFGLALLEANDGSASYYALNASAASVALIGVAGVTLSATSLNLDVNGSSGPSGSPVVNFAASYPASSGTTQAGLTVSTGPGTSVLLNDTTSVLSAYGTVTLGVGFSGQPAISLSAFVTFEDTTDGNNSQVIELSLQSLSVSFGSPAIFSINSMNGASAFFVITGSTMAGEVTVPLKFSIPANNPTVVFMGNISLEFNSGAAPVDTTFTDAASGAMQTLDVPGGPYVQLAGNISLLINSVKMTGSFQFQQVTLPGANGAPSQTAVEIAASNVSLTYSDPSYGSVSLTDGQGAFVFLPTGVAGQLSGTFSGNLPAIQAGGQVSLQINTTSTTVNQTVSLASGGSLQINVPANTFALGISNASINIDNIVTLTGNFQVTTEPGMTLYGASNVTLFLGEGPLMINGALNPNAIGIEVTNASIGVVKETSTGAYAVFAYGQVALVGLSPLSISGSIAVLINQTGQSLDVTVPLPSGSTPASVPVDFQSGAFLEEFAAGYDSNGQVDPTQLLTISASQVFTIQGAVQFTETSTGQVNVNVPTASVNITIPDANGNFPSTPTFSINGSAQFTIGGGQGFQLQSLQVNGFSIFGVNATIATPSTALRAPTATLSYPYDGQVIDVNQLNKQGYIEVHYNDVNNAGINVQNILNGSGQFTLSGADLGTVQVNDDPTQVSPSDDSDFEYHFEGQFVTTGANPTITVMFKPGSFGDNDGATNQTQYASFTLFNSTSQQSTQTVTLSGSPTGGTFVLGVSRPDTGAAGTISIPFGSTTSQVQSLFDAFFGAGNTTVTVANNDSLSVLFTGTLAGQTMPVFTVNSGGLTGGTTPGVGVTGNNAPATASLASPINGSSVNTQSMDQRAYIDVTFNVPGGDTVVDNNVLTGVVSLSGTAASNIAPLGAPTLVSGNTYRYSLTPASGVAMNQMFSDGVVVVNFSAATLTVQVPQGAGSTGTATVTVPLLASTESFTVTGAVTDESAASNPITLGPLSLSGPSLGLAGESFSGGTLDLTVAIGVASASLSFGGSQSGSGVTASLTDVLGTFNVQVNLIKLIPAILSKNVSAIVAAFSVPGSFGLSIGGLSIVVPNAVTITGTGITINYNPSFNPNVAPANSKEGALHGTDGLYHQKYLTIDSATVSLPEFGVSAGVSPYTFTPSGQTAQVTLPGLTIWDNGFTIGQANITKQGPLSLGSILTFNDLTLSVADFDVVFGQAVDFNGSVSISTTGATFLPGKPISATVSTTTPGQPAMSATLQFSGGHVQDVVFSVNTFSIKVTSFVTFVGHQITLDTSAAANQPIVTIGSIGVQITLGSLALTGSAQDFEFLGDGTFVPLKGFGVVLGVGSASGSSFMWPSWLPIQLTELGVQWPNGIVADPSDMLITISANITGIQGLGGLTFTGSVQGIQIDVGMLLAGQFPIVGIQSFGVTVSGNMFGGQISAGLIGGILKLDANGNMIASTDTTTPVAERVFFAGLQGGFSFGGMAGFSIQLGLSSLGPLGVQISVNLPEGILVDPDTGLSINNFVAGVKFFTSLPSITDPTQLNDPAFNVQSVSTAGDWLTMIENQVVAQYKAILNNPGESGFLAAFTAPMEIIGSATVYSIYTSQQLFNGQVTVEFSTDGKFLVIGKLNFADNQLSISGKLYADLSRVASGSVTVLFLANIPDQVQLLTIDGP